MFIKIPSWLVYSTDSLQLTYKYVPSLSFPSLSNHILQSCLILGSPTLLWTGRSPCRLLSPSAWVLLTLPPTELSSAALALWFLSTQSSLYILSIEHSHVWFFIISNVFMCSHLIGITGLSAAWEQRLYIVFPRTPPMVLSLRWLPWSVLDSLIN